MKRAFLGGAATIAATACTLVVGTDGLSDGPVSSTDAGEASPAADGASTRDAATAACPAPEPDLLAYFRFDDGQGTIAQDCSGKGHDGLITAPTWTAGKRGGALMFDGASTCLVVGDSMSMLSTGAFTTAAFVSVATYADAVSGKAHYIIGKSSQVPDKIGWRFASDATTRFGLKIGAPSNAVEVMTPDGQPSARWLHVAAVFDPGKRLEIWLDGVLLGSLPAPAALTDDPTAGVRVGCLRGTANFFNGAVDELRVYGRALSQDEIGTLARSSALP